MTAIKEYIAKLPKNVKLTGAAIFFILFGMTLTGNPESATSNQPVITPTIDQVVIPLEVAPEITNAPEPEPELMPVITPSPTPAPVSNPTPTPAPTYKPTTTYSCNCSKTCGQMVSCQEAYYQLNSCGCGKRDGDNDGIPCEEIC